jgi:hypothetical protein
MDLASSGSTLFVNFWNWRPTIELICAFSILACDRVGKITKRENAFMEST